MNIFLKIFLTSLSFIVLINCLYAKIKSDEDVIFYNTYMYYNNANEVILNIHGCIYEPETNSVARKIFIKSISEILDLPENGTDDKIFAERMRWFLVDNERGKKIKIIAGNKEFELNKSGANGHFYGSFQIEKQNINGLTDSKGVLKFKAQADSREFSGQAQLIGRTGISVISDIDDTIKISNVLNKKELMKNTFTRPFQKVPRMQELYSSWSDKGFAFHYVSGSPWQLYQPLHDFFTENNFPLTTIHLKYFRIKDSSILKFTSSDQLAYKTEVISSIINNFPERKFILIGDSGEKDPEVYAEIYNKYKNQISAIFIRDTSNPKDTDSRYNSLFKDKQVIFNLFKDPDALLKYEFK
jgi:phosphatidate phosphatase APP1